MDPDEKNALFALARLIRRRPKVARLSPLKILEIVTAHGFACQVCDAPVAAHPRAVLATTQRGETDVYVTVCDGCRAKVMEKESRERVLDSASVLFRTAIEGMLRSQDISDLVAEYFDEESQFAGTSFDLVGTNDPWRFAPDDVLAVSFLDTPIRASSWRAMERQSGEIVSLLLRIDPELPLWELHEDSETFAASNELWDLLLGISGIGVTRASKLMARKRPHLIPILDRRVREFYGNTEKFWEPLGRVLEDEDLRNRIRALAPRYLESELSVLRILDVAVWRYQRGIPPGTVAGDED